MPLEVICLCTYLVTENYGLWRPQDHNASKFVKALKGETLNGYAYVPVLGVQRHLDNSNLDESIVWFGDLVASYMQQHGMNPPFVLVPVPNSSSTTKDSSSRPRTRKLARAIAAKIGQGTTVADCLRWKQNLGSARKGTGVATRDAATLYSNLAVIEKIDGSNPYILIDDAIASGGHLQACAAMLAKRGATVVSAFCGGGRFTNRLIRLLLPCAKNSPTTYRSFRDALAAAAFSEKGVGEFLSITHLCLAAKRSSELLEHLRSAFPVELSC